MLYTLRNFIIKIEKITNLSLFIFFPFRLLLVVLEYIFLKKNKSLSKFSNYFIDSKKLQNKDLVIISGGVGTDISFEEKIYQSFRIKKIILIDPTKISKELLNQNDKFLFENYALFTNNNDMKIFFKEGNVNLSLENLFNTNSFFYVKCITINEIMKKYSIKKIDILKLDIEGVADKVIIKALDDNIEIDQICFELERPIKLLKQYDYFIRFVKIIRFLKKHNYTLYNCSQLKLGLRSEILALRRVA